jgi:hypothetical protein
MKTKKKLFALVATMLLSTAGYAANSEQHDSRDCAGEMTASGNIPEAKHGGHMMHSGKQGHQTMHSGMQSHHTMHPGVSPVTINIQPGSMPMWSNNMMHQGWGNNHKGHGEGREGKKRHHNNKEMHHAMRKQHMEQIEQRLENIEALLTELVELQKTQ